MQLKYNSVLKIVSSIFCFIGLTYHSSQLFTNYLQGKTIVKIDVNIASNQTLPGLTICYQYLLSFEKLSNLDDYYKEQYGLYQRLLSETSEKFIENNSRFLYESVVNDVLDKINN